MPKFRRIPLWIPFTGACIAALTLIALSFWSLFAYRASANVTLNAAEVVTAEASLLLNLVEAESAQRAYILTGDDAFLATYNTSAAKVQPTVNRLEDLLGSRENQLALVSELRPLVDAKLGELQRTVDLNMSGQRNEAQTIVDDGSGAEAMVAVRAKVVEIATIEAERHTDARSTASTRLRLSIVAVSALAVLVASALVYVYYTLQRRGVEDGLRQLNREKDEFLGMVSHELRTPITVVMGNASLLRRKWTVLSDDDRGTALRDIEHETNRLHGVVSNMLRLSRPERVVTPELEPLLLRRLVDRAVDRHTSRFPVPAVHVVEAGPVPPVLGHEEYLGQVLDNLLSNAAKYGSRTEPIEVRIDQIDGRAEVSILDRGPGIDKNLRERIFVAFERLPDADTKGEGLGLGLPICRMLMHAQGGDVDVADRQGGGSAFTVTLQLVNDAHEAEHESAMSEKVFAETV